MRGFRDNLPPISYKFECIRKIFEEISYEYAVDLIELPLIESAELYFRTSGEESEICNKELFEVRKYKSKFENWVLRPEGTASCVRAIKETNYLEEKKFCRLGYYGPMFRYNRPQKGRYRQFNQAGFEWLGCNNKYIDLEIILAACKILEKLEVSYELEINSIGDIKDRAGYRAQLRECFEVSGDPFKVLDKLDQFSEIPKMEINEKDKETLEFILTKLKNRKINIRHNEYLVRGLDYYNGIVFEFKNEGQTILAGGRYDGLMEQLGGNSTPAIGFALGVDRVADIMNFKRESSKDIAIISIEEDEYAYLIAEKIRNLGYSVYPLWGVDLKKGLKLASKSHRYVVIAGNSEKLEEKFLMKDLLKSKQKEVLLSFQSEDLLKFE